MFHWLRQLCLFSNASRLTKVDFFREFNNNTLSALKWRTLFLRRHVKTIYKQTRSRVRKKPDFCCRRAKSGSYYGYVETVKRLYRN